MKTFQYGFSGPELFQTQIEEVKNAASAGSAVIFHVFAEAWCDDQVKAIHRIIKDAIPHALLVGTASFGNIMEGRCSREDIVICAQVFEQPDTRLEAFCLDLSPERIDASLSEFKTYVRERPWVKGIEAFIMGDAEMVTHCCASLSDLPREIEFFGGKSRFDHSPEAPKFVINDEGECLSSKAVFVLYGGSELHIKTDIISGWNPLGRPMKVTKSSGEVLNELDGRPAYEMYYKYLHINNDENYFFKALEFPFLFYKDGKPIIRISHACLPDGSMMLGATLPENDYVRIGFGDSNEILRSVFAGGREFEAFSPESIMLYSCACRRTYWGDEASNQETVPFHSLAPTNGFYTAGEILRTDGVITEYNSAVIIAAMREGDASSVSSGTFDMNDRHLSTDDSLISRLCTFVSAAIEELEETNKKLEILSITDGLTGLFNRRETERLIHEKLPSATNRNMSVIMMDLDDFKDINDTFGHHEGDVVLQGFSALLKDVIRPYEPGSFAGRWGGEEFIVFLDGYNAAAAQALAEKIRAGYAGTNFEKSGLHTVSIGVTEITPKDNPDTAISRVDAAMYAAKQGGKNRVILG